MANTTMHNEYVPDYVSPPGETLEEALQIRGMSQAELARRTGRPSKTINEIVQGKAQITPETALQLERVLGIPAGFWMAREQHYREALARRDEVDALAGRIDWLNTIPVQEMVANGWIMATRDKVQQLREVLDFFGIASPEQWHDVYDVVAFRQSSAYQANPRAVAAWLRKGELDARDRRCEPYDSRGFRQVLGQIRPLTIEPPNVFQPKLVERCAGAGVAVVFVRELPRTGISGATYWLAPGKAVIQLSLRYKTNDQLWFTFFHEAGHILLHGKRDTFLEGENLDNQEERQANQFAAEMLIPRTDWNGVATQISRMNRLPSLREIQEWSYEIGVAPGILVGRLQHEQLVPVTHYNKLKVKLTWAQKDN